MGEEYSSKYIFLLLIAHLTFLNRKDGTTRNDPLLNAVANVLATLKL